MKIVLGELRFTVDKYEYCNPGPRRLGVEDRGRFR